MSIPTGLYRFGPDNGELLVHTKRTGAAAKAGHDLIIEVTSWNATLVVGEGDSSVSLQADGGSLRVREGTGGIQALGDDEKAGIAQTIDEEILKRSAITFRSSEVHVDGERLSVSGELSALGKTVPTQFDLLHSPEGRLTGSAEVKQTDLGLKPYSILFGTLKVTDAVTVTFSGQR